MHDVITRRIIRFKNEIGNSVGGSGCVAADYSGAFEIVKIVDAEKCLTLRCGKSKHLGKRR
jgi:hypothetical protein